MNILDHIETAQRFAGQGGSIQESACPREDHVKSALEKAKRLAESKPSEDKPVVLGAFPVPN